MSAFVTAIGLDPGWERNQCYPCFASDGEARQLVRVRCKRACREPFKYRIGAWRRPCRGSAGEAVPPAAERLDERRCRNEPPPLDIERSAPVRVCGVLCGHDV